jgi:hypothetical protein
MAASGAKAVGLLGKGWGMGMAAGPVGAILGGLVGGLGASAIDAQRARYTKDLDRQHADTSKYLKMRLKELGIR